MADATADTATPDVSGLTPEQINKYLTLLRVGQGLPNVQPDQTPVDTSGFWGGLRHGISLLGEAAGSPGPGALGALSPKEREQAGLQALSRFGTGLMAASHYVPGQTLGSNLAQGFQAAEHGYDTTARQAMGMLAARQGYAVESQHADLEKLKAALPLLLLQQKIEAFKGMPDSLLGTVARAANIGAGGSIGGPFMTALAQIESGDANIVSRVDKDSQGKTLAQGGNPAEISQGHYQINPGTWLRYAKQAGVDPSQFPNPMKAPKEVQAAVASVIPLREFGPRTQKLLRDQFGDLDTSKTIGALAGARAAPSAPGTAAAPPKAAPGQAPSPKAGGIQVTPEPPLATTAPAQTAQGPEEGTVQVAGTGAPTSGVIPASPPGSAQDVADIEAGRAEARANPLVRQPGAVVTAQAGGQPPDPDSFEAYRLAHPIAPPAPEQRMLFDAGLTPEQQKAHDTQLRALDQDYKLGVRLKDPARVTAAQEKLVALETATSTLRENARKLAVEKQAEYYKDQDKQRFDAWTAQRAQQNKQAEEDRKHANALELARINAEETRTSKEAEQEGQVIVDERKDMAKSRDAARQAIDQVHVLRALSDRAGTATALENITLPNGQTIRDVMVQHGLGDEKTLAHLNSQQAYEVAATQMVMDLRKGVQMGNLSDGDLRFLQKVVPKGSVTPEGRADMLATIELIHDRKREYIDRVHQLWDQGKGLSWEKAKVEADKQMGDIVPQVPQEYKTMSDQERDVWWKANTKPRMLLRTPDELNKDGKVTKRGHIIMVPEAPQ